MSNCFFGTCINKKGCHSFMTEFVLNNYADNWDNKLIIAQNAKCFKITTEFDNKEITLYKNKIREVITVDSIKSIKIKEREHLGYKVIETITMDSIKIYNKTFDINSNLTFIVSKNGVNAHGKTIKECLMDIAFKMSERNTKQYSKLTLNSELDIETAYAMYRNITGACKVGVQSFLDNCVKTKEFYEKDTIKIKDIIRITQGQYGNDKIVAFFSKKGDKQ